MIVMIKSVAFSRMKILYLPAVMMAPPILDIHTGEELVVSLVSALC